MALNADESSRTFVGQTSTQKPQPLHRSTVMATKPLAIPSLRLKGREQSPGQNDGGLRSQRSQMATCAGDLPSDLAAARIFVVCAAALSAMPPGGAARAPSGNRDAWGYKSHVASDRRYRRSKDRFGRSRDHWIRIAGFGNSRNRKP